MTRPAMMAQGLPLQRVVRCLFNQPLGASPRVGCLAWLSIGLRSSFVVMWGSFRLFPNRTLARSG